MRKSTTRPDNPPDPKIISINGSASDETADTGSRSAPAPPSPVSAEPASSASESNPASRPPQPDSTFDLASTLELDDYRVSQSFAEHLQVVKKPISIPVGRPNDQEWICFHPSNSWQIIVNLLEDKLNRRTYLVGRSLFPELLGDIRPKLLVAYATLRGTWGLWPIRIRGERGELDSYSESLHAIVLQHAGQWIRVITNLPDGVYVPLVSEKIEAPEARWPEGGFSHLFQLAFQNSVITSLDHPFLRHLRGEI